MAGKHRVLLCYASASAAADRPLAGRMAATSRRGRNVASLAEKLLLRLSRDPKAPDYPAGPERKSLEHSLDLLREVFPGFLQVIQGRRVLDFGCGDGYQAVAMSQSGAAFVLGLDTNLNTLAQARELAEATPTRGHVEFAAQLEPRFRGAFDIVISQNSFEHFPDPGQTLGEMKSALDKGGAIFLTFAPPWYAPYGSHMHFFTKVPWVNILLSERTVMNVRKHFRNDGAMRYEDVESGLNKMSVRKFEKLVSGSGLRIERKSYDCVKRANFLGSIPLIRELFVNRISCALRL